MCQSGRSDEVAADAATAGLAAGTATAGAEAEGAGLTGAAVRFAGADGLGADATGGAELLLAPPALVGVSFPGRKANIRKSVMAKPVCSSGASDKSGRLVMLI